MMESRPKPPPTSAAKKRSRERAELEALAATFQADWRPGDKVARWLSRHEGRSAELSRLVDDGWSWADIGLAMQIAGISYSSGEPIAADILRWKAYRARQRELARAGREAAKALKLSRASPEPGGLTTPASAAATGPTVSIPTQPETPVAFHEAGQATPEEPKFRPVRLKAGSPLPTPQLPSKRLPYPQAEIEEVSDEEIVRRVLGKS